MKADNRRSLEFQNDVDREPPTILVADDDNDLRSLISSEFERQGYTVIECREGSELLSKLGSYLLFNPSVRIDLVVSDIVMPGATALDILDAVAACERMPPPVILIAFPSRDLRDAAQSLCVSAVHAKPFELSDLVASAEQLLFKSLGDPS